MQTIPDRLRVRAANLTAQPCALGSAAEAYVNGYLCACIEAGAVTINELADWLVTHRPIDGVLPTVKTEV